ARRRRPPYRRRRPHRRRHDHGRRARPGLDRLIQPPLPRRGGACYRPIMHQLPIFVTLAGRPVVLVGDGEAAAAKARLIVRAGGRIVPEWEDGARLAFVVLADEAEARAAAEALCARGLLVNV